MAKHTRRAFLATALPGTIAIGSSIAAFEPLLSASPKSQIPAAAQTRSYTSAKAALELAGKFSGWLESVEGGRAESDVVLEKIGLDHIQHKHLAGVKYDDITVNCGTGMSKSFYDWIGATCDKKFARNSGAIVIADFNYKPISRMEWFNALISEVGFPALDAGSKDPAKMTVSIRPELTRMVATSGAPNVITGGRSVQKAWLPSNFRLKIDGCPDACTRVSKIDALTVKTVLSSNPAGDLRNYQTQPVYLNVSNLVITADEAHSAELYQWHEDFVIKGNNGRDKLRGGTLEFLTPDLREILFTLTFRGLGIFRLNPESVVAGAENIRRVKAEMYCEDIGFTYGPSAAVA